MCSQFCKVIFGVGDAEVVGNGSSDWVAIHHLLGIELHHLDLILFIAWSVDCDHLHLSVCDSVFDVGDFYKFGIEVYKEELFGPLLIEHSVGSL